MTLSRRKAIALIGGGTIVAAGAGAAAFLATRDPSDARAPWAAAGGYADPRKRALSFALLAPNPHNLQPWLVELTGDDTVTLWHDTARRLPHTDPFDRQLTIGFGCFLEQMAIAATADGLNTRIALFPDGDTGPVARAVFTPGASRDPMAAAIPDRRSCKQPFEDRPVEPGKAGALEDFATVITQPGAVATLRDLTWQAWLTEWQTPRTRRESIDLMRFGKAEINANPDGIALGGPLLDSLMLAGMLTPEGQDDPASSMYRQGVDMYRAMLMATPAYAVIATAGNSREDQIDAGRRWLRLNLAATQAGLALHPVSQALQEYDEMKPHYARAHDVLAGPGETVQMLGRLGYGPQTPPAPRWPLEARMRQA